MFSRSQPREVYRVYGEDDFFAEQNANAEDYPHHPEPRVPEHDEHQALTPQVAHQPEPAVNEFSEPPSSEHPTAEYSPPVGEYHQPASAAAFGAPPPLQEERDFEEFPARAGGVYAANNTRRRMLGMLALAAIFGLVVGLIAVSSMHSGGKANKTPPVSASSAQQVPRTTNTTPQVKIHKSPSHAHIASPHHPSAVRVVHNISHTHITVTHAAVISAPVTHTNSEQSQSIPVPASAPAVPASAPAPSYTPPSSSQTGVEFGFEN